MDARPLPALGIPDAKPRDHILGALGGAWMYFDGEWRLHRYGTGEALLFNVREDPQEQRNLMRDPRYLDTYLRLEAALTQEVMCMMVEAHHDRRVYVRDLSQYDWFGREGWQRPYPRKVQDTER
jgi:arylsulfatase A-like enzyme